MSELNLLSKNEIERFKKDVEQYELGNIQNPTHIFKQFLRAIKTIEQLEQQILCMNVKNEYKDSKNCTSTIGESDLIEINKDDRVATIDKSITADKKEMIEYFFKLMGSGGYIHE